MGSYENTVVRSIVFTFTANHPRTALGIACGLGAFAGTFFGGLGARLLAWIF